LIVLEFAAAFRCVTVGSLRLDVLLRRRIRQRRHRDGSGLGRARGMDLGAC